MSAEIATGITEEPLETGALIDSARRDTCGAVASFVGVVRNHDGGESVDAIEYSSHPSSQQILRDIVVEFRDRPGVHCMSRGTAWGIWRLVRTRWSSPSLQSIVRRLSVRLRRSSRM